jgi:hypothetical protein
VTPISIGHLIDGRGEEDREAFCVECRGLLVDALAHCQHLLRSHTLVVTVARRNGRAGDPAVGLN